MGAVNTGDKRKGTAARPSALLCGLLAAILVVCALAALLCRRASKDPGEVHAPGPAEPSQAAIADSETLPKQNVVTVGESNGENLEEGEAFAARRHRLRRKMKRMKLMEQQGPKFGPPSPRAPERENKTGN